MGKKTQKQREDAFLRLLSNFTVEQQQQNLPDRVDLMAFFDLLDEHNVQVRQNKKWIIDLNEEQMPLGKRSLLYRRTYCFKRLETDKKYQRLFNLPTYVNRLKTRKLTTFVV